MNNFVFVVMRIYDFFMNVCQKNLHPTSFKRREEAKNEKIKMWYHKRMSKSNSFMQRLKNSADNFVDFLSGKPEIREDFPTSNHNMGHYVQRSIKVGNNDPVTVDNWYNTPSCGSNTGLQAPPQYARVIEARSDGFVPVSANIRGPVQGVSYHQPAPQAQMAAGPSAVAQARAVENFEPIREGLEESAGSQLQQPQLPVAGAGQEPQVIIYDRIVTANKKSRLHGQGDYIRGDLPIAPSNLRYFRPSVNPNLDLNTGAMAVLGGAFNETSRSTIGMAMQDAGDSRNTFAGIAWKPSANPPASMTMATPQSTFISAPATGSGVTVQAQA